MTPLRRLTHRWLPAVKVVDWITNAAQVWCLVVATCLTVTTGSQGPSSTALTDFCEQWKTYKDPLTGKCLPCSRCPEDHLVVVLCEFDRDTLCRPSTDLAEHIQSVITSNPPVIVMVEEQVIDNGTYFSPALLGITLTALAITCLVLAGLHLVKKLRSWKERELTKGGPHHGDSLEQSLLGECDGDEEGGDPLASAKQSALDMDELLAQRYGRSLVTNHYVP